MSEPADDAALLPQTVAPRGDTAAVVPGGLPDRYEDLGPIAEGGFGEVRRVRDRHLNATLAMKLLKPDRVSAELKRRFLAEARITAWLNHPGIVAVQDLGELADGRVWYTMQEVRGQTLSDVIQAQRRGEGGWTLRRVVDALTRACQAVASAHAVGVVHRDLKPDNLMIGPFGEVRVMDWGLARRMGAPDELGAPSRGFEDGVGSMTVAGAVMGTPAYMPPEQARGELEAIGPWSDVYALGATLYEVLTGRAPYLGGGRAAWSALLRGPPDPIPPGAPPDLAELADLAMARDADERPREAGFLADELQRWLDGEAARDRALAAVARADALRPQVAALRAEAADADATAHAALSALPTWAPEADKRPAWALAQRADAAAIEADLLEVAYENQLRAALDTSRDLPEGIERLADLYRDQLLAAEAHQDARGVARAEARLRATGRHDAWLDRPAEVFLDTDPAGCRVVAEPWELDGLRLVPGAPVELGKTPLRGARLRPGSWRLTIHGPGGPTTLPVVVARGEAWRANRPGARAWIHRLPAPGELGPDDVFVPAGWARLGGDPDASDPEPARDLWVDDFVIRRDPVTLGAYAAFLDALVDAGRADEADALQPAEVLGGFAPVLERVGARFAVTNRRGWPATAPVPLVDAKGAWAFAAWEAARTGQPWGLPVSLAWEKAARGVDGRPYPWGPAHDPCLTNCTGSTAASPALVSVDAAPFDVSPYGVRGLGGNLRDWCADAYAREGAAALGGVVDLSARAGPGQLVAVRGGAHVSTPSLCRAASRFAAGPDARFVTLGFRLARPFRSASS